MYQRPQPESLPQRNIKVRLPVGHLLISTTRLMIAVHHFPSPRAEPDYTIHFAVIDNPELAELFHPVDGWDYIGLLRFLWRKIDVLKSLDLRDPTLRAELGLRTVPELSQKPKRQEKRPAEQALKLIQDFVIDHPDCTRLEIARGIERAKSPHLRAQIEWLVYTGVLARKEIIRPEGTLEYRYVYIGQAAD